MAFDGITVACIVQELDGVLRDSRIYKIAQPEKDELLLTFKTAEGQRRLVLSADASLPLIYLTQDNKPSPMTAPNFCMLLRKHIQNGRIKSVTQPGLERIVRFEIEHLNEMGDLCRSYLILELMGKHSNLIFCNREDVIIDSIKHISGMVSSVREVLPGRSYFVPNTLEKLDPLSVSRDAFSEALCTKPVPCYKALYTSFTGLSPSVAQELCFRAQCDAGQPASTLPKPEFDRLYEAFDAMMTEVRDGHFSPGIVYENGVPVEFSCIELTSYPPESRKCYSSVSFLLEDYYAQKNAHTRIRQRSSELRRIVQTALERNFKKYDLQLRQMKDTQKRDKYRVYGELLNTYGYSAAPGDRELTAVNYYNGETLQIPLDPTLTPSENAKKYFDKYNKLKRTYEALSELTVSVKAEIDHLESIAASLDIAGQEADLAQIREELIENGYLKRKGGRKGRKEKITSRPFHYISSDGYHMYVGKNNFQNDELTFRFAAGNDWWFHAKGLPGSHVIVKTGDGTLPDSTFEEAARLAAYYSRARDQEKAEIDYTQKKNVKKPNGSKPGFVVYYTNYSMAIGPDISRIRPADSEE